MGKKKQNSTDDQKHTKTTWHFEKWRGEFDALTGGDWCVLRWIFFMLRHFLLKCFSFFFFSLLRSILRAVAVNSAAAADLVRRQAVATSLRQYIRTGMCDMNQRRPKRRLDLLRKPENKPALLSTSSLHSTRSFIFFYF